jgi:hypothetical protein
LAYIPLLIKKVGTLTFVNGISALIIFYVYFLLNHYFGTNYQALFLFSIMVAGIISAVVDAGCSKFLARLVAQKRIEEIVQVRVVNSLYYSLSGFWILFVFFGYDWFLVNWFNEKIPLELLNSQTALFFLMSGGFSILNLGFTAVAVGSGDYQKQVLLASSNGIFSYIPLVAFMLLGGQGEYLGLFLLIGKLLHIIIMVYVFSPPQLRILFLPKFDIKIVRILLPIIKILSPAAFFNLFLKSADRIVISLVASKEFFVFYELMIQIFQRASIPIVSYLNLSYKSLVENTNLGANLSLIDYLKLTWSSIYKYVYFIGFMLTILAAICIYLIVNRPLSSVEFLMLFLLFPTFIINGKSRIMAILVLASANEKIYLKVSIVGFLTSSSLLCVSLYFGESIFIFYLIIVQTTNFIFYSNFIKNIE